MSLECNVLLGNLGSWHSCGCHVDATLRMPSTHPKYTFPWRQFFPMAFMPWQFRAMDVTWNSMSHGCSIRLGSREFGGQDLSLSSCHVPRANAMRGVSHSARSWVGGACQIDIQMNARIQFSQAEHCILT